jgi:fumarate reductase flavoprotein subunit
MSCECATGTDTFNPQAACGCRAPRKILDERRSHLAMPLIRTDTPDFDASVPVVIVGAGACGMTAALAAADAGTEVMVLERDARPFGTTSMSQGFICAAATQAQRNAGIDDSAELMFADIMAKTKGQTDPALARIVAEASGPTIDWLMQRHAMPLTVEQAWAGHFGHSRPRLHGLPERTGGALLAFLLREAEQAGVSLVTGARLVDLFVDSSDIVRGVALVRPDGRRETLGCEALVLATSGFGANREMVRRFITDMADSPYFGHEGDDGSGIELAMELGAATADMGAFQGYGALAREIGVLVNYNIVMEGGIEVNRLGERFSDELADISGQAMKVLAQPNGEAWVIYDERRHLAARRWHEYQLLEQAGGVRTAPTVAALAERSGLPADVLGATVAHVQALANGRGSDRFGRDFRAATPLEGPFYAAKVTGALFHTQGGLVVNAHAQVCRPDGSVLPNLFAGGGAARSISGPGAWGYLPAAGLCMAVTLGRLAGEAAASLATVNAA